MRFSSVLLVFLAAIVVTPAASPAAESHQPTRAAGATEDSLVHDVSAPKRQTRKTALRVKIALVRAAKITIRLRQPDDAVRWKPIRMKGRKGENAIRISPGDGRRMPTGRYRLKVSARAGDVESSVWKLAVRVVRARAR